MTLAQPRGLELELMPWRLAVCRLPAGAPEPEWGRQGEFYSLTRTPKELSLVCSQEAVPAGVRHQGGWRALRVRGVLEFSLTGVLASLAEPLARAGISLFALSTHDTDYLLVQEESLPGAREALESWGHRVMPAKG